MKNKNEMIKRGRGEETRFWNGVWFEKYQKYQEHDYM